VLEAVTVRFAGEVPEAGETVSQFPPLAVVAEVVKLTGEEDVGAVIWTVEGAGPAPVVKAENVTPFDALVERTGLEPPPVRVEEETVKVTGTVTVSPELAGDVLKMTTNPE
jgi:hypothetical protein